MRKAPLFWMLTASLLLAPQAEAKNRDNAWEFGAYVSHLDGDRGEGVDNSVGFALRAGYNFSAKVEAELFLSRSSTEVFGNDAEFVRAMAVITGNFLTDRDGSLVPFVSAGLGVVNETIDAFRDSGGNQVPESFDSAAIITLGVGARNFFTDNWGIRYEGRYVHHDLFEEGQNEYIVAAGVTWLVGGQK